MKHLEKIIGLMAGFAMAVAVGAGVISSKESTPVHAASTTYEVTAANLTGWTSTQGSQTGSSGGFTIESNNAANNTQIRLYSGGTHTFTSTVGNITKAVFTCTANGTNNYGPGKMSGSGYTASSGKTGTWEGNAASFTLSGGQSRVTSIVFTYDSSITTYTISYDANGGSGTMSPTTGVNPAVASCTFTAPSGQQFKEWNTQADGSGITYAVGATLSADLTLYAIWEITPTPTPVTKRCYSLVTSTDSLVAGAKYIIASSTELSNHAMSTTQNKNNRAQEDININETVAPISSDSVQVVTLEGSEGAWNFAVSGGYLYAASSSANHLKTESSVDANGNANWTITFSGSIASIVAQGNYSRNVMQYNAGSSLFACYASDSQTDISLYRLDFEETLLGNITCDGSGSHSMPEGYTWNTDLASVYNDLPASEKSSLASKFADIDSGLERYDYIVGKYNPQGLTTGTDYNHFITGRTVTPLGSARVMFEAIGLNSSNNIIVITIITLVSLTSLSLFLIYRKKHQYK